MKAASDVCTQITDAVEQRSARVAAETPEANCPKCKSDDIWRAHHPADFAAPECDYWQCMTCQHQWGHE